MWAMERAYFELRHKYPGKEEYAYLRLALRSRYLEKSEDEIRELVSGCRSLDDAIVAAVGVDFGQHVSLRIQMDVLWRLPPCSRCGKYRALHATHNLCYGCRRFPGFAACTRCRLYWDDYPKSCRQCGGPVWQITDGPGVPMIDLGRSEQEIVDGRRGPGGPSRSMNQGEELFGESGPDAPRGLTPQLEELEKRCAAIWDASVRDRRRYRELRRASPQAAREVARNGLSSARPDPALVPDLDRFFDALTNLYLEADFKGRNEVRSLMGGYKRLLGNIHSYAGRLAQSLGKDGNPKHLLCGLAAVSIDDERSCQEYGYVLGSLYKNALERGLRPSEWFSAVANISNDGARRLLQEFESSRDFTLYVGRRVNRRA